MSDNNDDQKEKASIEEVPDEGVFVLQGKKRIKVMTPVELYSYVDPKDIPSLLESVEPKHLPTNVYQSADVSTTGRITFDFESKVGDVTTHRMHTKGMLDYNTGYITASTRTRTANWLSGFHADVKVIFVNSNQIPVGGTTAIHRFGVGGTWDPTGPNDRTDYWSERINPERLNLTEYSAVVHQWSPNSIETIINNAINTVKPFVQLLKELKNTGAEVSELFRKKEEGKKNSN